MAQAEEAKPDFERLTEAVRRNEPGADAELWEAVRRFVRVKAIDRANKANLSGFRRVSPDDLEQAGFLATLDAAKIFDERRETSSFLSLLAFRLKSAFDEEIHGTRSKKRDALQYADSIEKELFPESGGEGVKIADAIPDRNAELAFVGIEYADFLTYCRKAINGALETLPQSKKEIMKAHYLHNVPRKDIAAARGITEGAVTAAIADAVYKIRRGKYAARLRECLNGFNDYRANDGASGIRRPTETAALSGKRM